MENIKIEQKFGLEISDMAKAGLHFGHRTSKLHPKMKPYIYGVKKTIHIIDLNKTIEKFSLALDAIKNLSQENKVLLLVGTKIQHKQLIKDMAKECNLPYVSERWLGGLLTNFESIAKRVKYFHEVREKVASEGFDQYTKKEQSKIKKELEKLERKFGGIEDMGKIPAALFICDVKKDEIAVREARKMNIPIIAVVDTNADPSLIDWPIPASDDPISAAKYVLDKVKQTILENKGKKEEVKKEVKEEAQKEEVKKEKVKKEIKKQDKKES